MDTWELWFLLTCLMFLALYGILVAISNCTKSRDYRQFLKHQRCKQDWKKKVEGS